MSLEAFDDEQLLAQLREGSHAAFATLVHRHATRFYRLAYRFIGRREEAEDIVQEAFLKLWERPDAWEAGRGVKFTTWFYRVITNRCLDFQKKHTPLSLLEEVNIADEGLSQDVALIRMQEQRALENSIRSLPERQRTALNLCFYEELTNQEAADVMKIPIKALQSLLMRAKTTLKERMKSYV